MEKSINKMGTMPVNKLMLTLGAPMIISMVLQAVYNIVGQCVCIKYARYGRNGIKRFDACISDTNAYGGGKHRYGSGNECTFIEMPWYG